MKGDIPEALQALVTETQRDVTGLVRLKLYKGNIIVAGRKSPKSLYDPKIATMEGDPSAYDQSDATGFIRLNALRLKLRAAMQGRRLTSIARIFVRFRRCLSFAVVAK